MAVQQRVCPLTCTENATPTDTWAYIVHRIGNSRITLTVSLSLYHLLLWTNVLGILEISRNPKELRRVSRILRDSELRQEKPTTKSTTINEGFTCNLNK